MPDTPYVEAWLAGPDGHSFYTRTYHATSPKAVAVFVHGFRDHISRHADVHAAFAQRHVTIFAYDLRGYGRTALDSMNSSPDASYGKTSRSLEIRDLEWWINHVAETNKRLPLFLMGFSGGGGLALVFPTRTEPPPSPQTVALLSGVIAISPLVELGTPAPRIARQLVKTVSSVIPTFPFYPPLPPERVSRDPEVVASFAVDPLLKTRAGAQAMYEMLIQGEEMLEAGWQRWPNDLPIIMLWGTANEVNSPRAGIDLFEKLAITDKRLVTYQGALDDLGHELKDVSERFLDDCVTWINAHLTTRRRLPRTNSSARR
ncbi:lysophospholipase [Polyporus arcularius HHB13444]|uniref:Lysophospholipase n=1 Tax=Polyporus arcularius HHB13444 TaxID=1314778 RepID=A0A5C3PDX8_9APHY|nr:lysophospholipase [Polyporus arcularius HHB13444]